MTASIEILGKTYQLGSFNKKNDRPMWEFAPLGETIHQWTTLLTIIDRPDATTPAEMDQLSEGVMAYFKSSGGQIMIAQTMTGEDGKNFNYMVAAFDEPKLRRFELNFVKIMMGPQNAITVIYGVRIQDAGDYLARTKAFLEEESSQIGHALGTLTLPPLESLPKKEF